MARSGLKKDGATPPAVQRRPNPTSAKPRSGLRRGPAATGDQTVHAELAAVAAKADLLTLSRQRGRVLLDEITALDGTAWQPGTLVFTGFAGRRDDADGQYHGTLRFRRAEPADEERASVTLAEMPGTHAG